MPVERPVILLLTANDRLGDDAGYLRGDLVELAEKLGEQYQLECDWQSDDCLNISRSGVDGRLMVGEQEIELTLKLGMLMSAFKGVIETEIKSFIAEHIY